MLTARIPYMCVTLPAAPVSWRGQLILGRLQSCPKRHRRCCSSEVAPSASSGQGVFVQAPQKPKANIPFVKELFLGRFNKVDLLLECFINC